MSRYKQSRKATNRDDMYKEVFEKKGVQKITQFRSKKLRQIEDKDKQKIKFIKYIWKYGDNFWLLAAKYYSDPKMWWVIAAFNNIPTENHIEIGDELKIPVNLSEALQVI